MEIRSVEAVIRALNEAKARYLVVGGLAVVAHGHVRFTADMDLVLDFGESSLRPGLAALSKLGYRPRAPVKLEDFADPANRRRWIEEKGLTVFSLHSPEHPATEIDIFAETPFDFDSAYASATRLEISPGLTATFVDLKRLLDLKSKAARPQDLQDIERLKSLKGDRDGR